VLVGGDDAPFGTVVALVRAYGDRANRLAVDARLALSGHAGDRGVLFEVVPGLGLRFALAAIYDTLVAGKDEQQRYDLDVRLGLIDEDDEDVEPTSRDDPKRRAALAEFGEATYE
jgi:hypothetical protein